MTKEERAVVEAAYVWWARRRPLSWSMQRHVHNPGVNTDAADERVNLANAVAAYVAANPHRGYRVVP